MAVIEEVIAGDDDRFGEMANRLSDLVSGSNKNLTEQLIQLYSRKGPLFVFNMANQENRRL